MQLFGIELARLVPRILVQYTNFYFEAHSRVCPPAPHRIPLVSHTRIAFFLQQHRDHSKHVQIGGTLLRAHSELEDEKEDSFESDMVTPKSSYTPNAYSTCHHQ
jgi:hypothetical protein